MELLRPKNHQQLPRSSKPNIAVICKKHPKHQQSPGVCSICLCEKLSQLSKASRSKNIRKVVSASINAAAEEEEEEEDSSCSSSSLSNYSPSQCSSCASSDCSSPVYGRMASDVRGSYLVSSRGVAAGRNYYHDQLKLMKSRSMAAAVTTSRRIRERISSEGTDRHMMKQKKKEKSHFWSKLLMLRRPGGKRFEEAAAPAATAGGLVHSRTMREMLTTAAH